MCLHMSIMRIKLCHKGHITLLLLNKIFSSLDCLLFAKLGCVWVIRSNWDHANFFRQHSHVTPLWIGIWCHTFSLRTCIIVLLVVPWVVSHQDLVKLMHIKSCSSIHWSKFCLVFILVDNLLPIVFEHLFVLYADVWGEVERLSYLLVNLEQKRDQAMVRQLYLQAKGGVQPRKIRLHLCLVDQIAQLYKLKGSVWVLGLSLQCVDDELDRVADVKDWELLVREDWL